MRRALRIQLIAPYRRTLQLHTQITPFEADIDRYLAEKKFSPVNYTQHETKHASTAVENKIEHDWVIPKMPPHHILVTKASEMPLEDNKFSFVQMFRSMAPYIAIHRDKTMILHIPGEVTENIHTLKTLVSDIALLKSIGVRIVLVSGCAPQIDKRLREKNLPVAYNPDGVRVTDDATLSCCRDAAGDVRLTLESILERGLASSPDSVLASYCRPNISSGNFLTAAPLGTVSGTDYCWTGRVRRIHVERISNLLDNGDIVILGNLGFSPFGELYNCSSIEVASHCAVQLQASKLIFLHEGESLFDTRRGDDCLISNLSIADAKSFISHLKLNNATEKDISNSLKVFIKAGIFACEKGVKRTHIVSRHQNGGLLSELFTRDGAGLIITRDLYEGIRTAKIEDIQKILKLIKPFVDDNIILPRSVSDIENELDSYVIVEREGTLVACSCLHVYEDNMAELACVAVSPEVRKAGTGDAMLGYQLRKAMDLKIEKVFALSTVTMDWFKERGFVPAKVSDLPLSKAKTYDTSRKSKIMVKDLTDPRVIDEQELLLNI